MFSWTLYISLPFLLLQIVCHPVQGYTTGLPLTQDYGNLTLADAEWNPVLWSTAKLHTGHNIIAEVSGNMYYITLTDVAGRPDKSGRNKTEETQHNCLYTGHLYNSSSQAIISLRPLVYGFFQTEQFIFLIEPVSRDYSNKRPINTTIPVTIRCHPTGDLDLPSTNSSRRTERQATLTSPITIKLMVTPGRYLRDTHWHHSSYVDDYLLTVIAIVNSLFRDPTLSSRVVVTVSREDSNMFNVHYGDSARSLHKRYCKYQNSQRKINGGDYDMAILFIGYTAPGVQWKGETDVTYSNAVCNNKTSCGVVRDVGMNSAFVVARMIGLWLGLTLDGMGNNKCSLANKQAGIMSPFLDQTNLWSWSSCSRADLQAILSQTTTTHDPIACLRDKASDYMGVLPPLRAALPNTLLDHCILRYHLYASPCHDNTTNDCEELKCSLYGRPCTSPIYLVHWPDETPCGGADSKFCYHRKCLSRSEIRELKKEKTLYSEWSGWSECSRSCGGGVQLSNKTCTRGLNDCRGKQVDIRSKSCNIEECPYAVQSFREEQCSRYNTMNVSWYPVYRRGRQQECKLVCETTSGTRRPNTINVVDGTRCNANSFDICVQGSCRPAGCDHRIMSARTLDKCGVCHGDGSRCVLENGYKAENNTDVINTGYFTVLTIPTGSSGIDVLKREIGTTKPSCFLAISDTAGRLLFEAKEGMRENAVFYGAGLLWWFRPLVFTSRQRVTLYGAINTAIKIEMRCSRQMKEYNVTWSYYKRLPPFDVFEWHLTNCAKEYKGKHVPTLECHRVPFRKVVDKSHCVHLPKPLGATPYNKCKTDYVWQLTRSCPSSLPCGDGVVLVDMEYKCFKLSLKSQELSRHPVDDRSCFRPKPDNEQWPCKRYTCGSINGPVGVLRELQTSSECKTKCGLGYKFSECQFVPVRQLTKREIRCSETSLQRMPCIGNVCPQNESTSSCAAWQQKGFRDDGEYTINKQGRTLQLYCYGMNTTNPTEYLTLPSGPKKNFGSIFSYEWNRTIAACPVDSGRQNYANYTDGGSSQFSKVRFHLNSMEIQTDDFMFAETVGSMIEYGTAGCFVSSDCTGVSVKGAFRVDFQGTGLEVVDIATQWRMVMIKKNGIRTRTPAFTVGPAPVEFQVVSGRCDLCSKCFIPSKRLKVKFVVPV